MRRTDGKSAGSARASLRSRCSLFDAPGWPMAPLLAETGADVDIGALKTDLQSRCLALEHRIVVAREQCLALAVRAAMQPGEDGPPDPLVGALHRVAAAWESLASAASGYELRAGGDDVSDSDIWQEDDVAEYVFRGRRESGACRPNPAASLRRLSAAAFGGPWLPRTARVKAGGLVEEVDAIEAERILKRQMADYREDRGRYVQQYMECRDLVLYRGHQQHAATFRSAPHGSLRSPPGSAPTTMRSSSWGVAGLPQAPFAPYTPPASAGASTGARRGGSRGHRVCRSQSRDLLLTQSGDGLADAFSFASQKVVDAFEEHMTKRGVVEERLRFWERETLSLISSQRSLQSRLRALELERRLRAELDAATLQVLALLELESCGD